MLYTRELLLLRPLFPDTPGIRHSERTAMVFLTSARWSHRAKAVGAGEETIVLALGGSPGKEDEGGRQMWAAEPDVEND